MSVLNNFTIFSVFKKNNMLYIIFSINNYVLKQEDLIVNIDNIKNIAKEIGKFFMV